MVNKYYSSGLKLKAINDKLAGLFYSQVAKKYQIVNPSTIVA